MIIGYRTLQLQANQCSLNQYLSDTNPIHQNASQAAHFPKHADHGVPHYDPSTMSSGDAWDTGTG